LAQKRRHRERAGSASKPSLTIRDIGRTVRITITSAAYEAIAATLPLGSVAVEPERAQDGGVGIWLDHATVARLKALRGPGESYSDLILRLAADYPSAGGLMPPGLHDSVRGSRADAHLVCEPCGRRGWYCMEVQS
jgi:hypothetical protein